MAKVQDIISQVASLPGPHIDAALAAALPTAEPGAKTRLVQELLDRNQPASRLGIINNYHFLDNDLQKRIGLKIRDFSVELSLSVGQAHPQTVRNAVELIQASGQIDLADLLPDALRQPHPDIQQMAAQTLLAFAWQVATEDAGQTKPTAKTIQVLLSALKQAVHSYHGHRRREILEALAILGPAAIDWIQSVLADPRHQVVMDLCRLLEEAEASWVRRSLSMFLLIPTLNPSALAGLKLSRARGYVDVFTHPHLLLLPSMRAVLRRMGNADSILVPVDQYSKLRPKELLSYVLWLEHLSLTPIQRIEALAGFRFVPEPKARLAAVRLLISMRTEPVAEAARRALAEFHQDPCPAIAQLALHALWQDRWPPLPRLLPYLINAKEDAVRCWATRYLAHLAFDRLWSAWPKLNEMQKIAAGSAQLKMDPLFLRRLGDRMTASDRKLRLRSLAIIATLGQGSSFEDLLLTMIQDPDATIVASAVRALGSTSIAPWPPSPRVKAAFHQTLHHGDARVRANTVEALEHLGVSDHVPRLLEMARQESGRPRANAIKALLRLEHPSAPDLLDAMLQDRRASQRISALWVVESLPWIASSRQVAEMAIHDPDPLVRRRADKAIQQLLFITSSQVPTDSPQPGPTATHPRISSFFAIIGPAIFYAFMINASTLRAAESKESVEAWAPNERWTQVGSELARYWQQDVISLPLTALWILLACLGLVLVLAWMLGLRRQPGQWHGPLRTFWRLAGTLGLSWPDRILLVRVAKREKLPGPLVLLLSAATLEYHGRSFAGRCLMPRRIEARLHRIRHRIFEEANDSELFPVHSDRLVATEKNDRQP